MSTGQPNLDNFSPKTFLLLILGCIELTADANQPSEVNLFSRNQENLLTRSEMIKQPYGSLLHSERYNKQEKGLTMACQSLHEPTSQPPSPSLITPGELISYPHPTPQGFCPCSSSSSRCLHGSLLLNKIFSLEPLKTAAIAPSLHTLPCPPSLFSLACIPSDIGYVTVSSMRAVSWCAVANSASPGHPIPNTRYVHESVHIAYIQFSLCNN